MDGSSVLDVDRQSRHQSLTIGGNVLGPKRIVLLGASIVQGIKACHHLETTHDEEITESERRKAQGFVKQTLVDAFRKSKPQYQGTTLAEDTEYSDDLAYGIDLHFFQGTQHDENVLDGCCKSSLGRDIRLGFEGSSFHIHDIGGKTSERKEWATYFQAADSFMFAVSLISYSKPSWRDPNTTQMQEYLMLFESICKCSGLRTVPIILLLNNFDLLRRRMKDFPVKDSYPDYSGSSNPSIFCRYFAGKFVELVRTQRLTVYVANKVEQDDEDLQSTVDELCPDLFPKGLTTVPELPE